jgi:hypothetical protein
MLKSTEIDRLSHKSLDGQFLWELENGFELSPRESRLILETISVYYSQSPESRAGRVSLWVVERGASVGKALESVSKVQVWATLDGGDEDLEIYRRYGQVGLRRQRLLRVSEEIVDQGGIATQSDLARLLGTSVRTIKRDIAYFRDHGITVLTRGVYSDIGAGVSHKRIIVEMYLSGMVYTEICRRMRHSARAVKRYVSTFARVVSLYEHGVQEVRDISYYVGISSRLAEEYVELYIHFKGYSHYRSRIEDLLVQLSSRPAYGEDSTKKKDMIGGMK